MLLLLLKLCLWILLIQNIFYLCKAILHRILCFIFQFFCILQIFSKEFLLLGKQKFQKLWIHHFSYIKPTKILILMHMQMVQEMILWMHPSLFLLCSNCMARMSPSNTWTVLLLLFMSQDYKDFYNQSHLNY